MSRTFKHTPDVILTVLADKTVRNRDFETVRQSCYFATGLAARVRSYAQNNGLSTSAVIATAVREFLARREG